AGFDGIEVHGAHGYLPDLFLWDRTSRRADAYGGALADRTRFAVEVVNALRDELGPRTPISFRFSQWKADLYDARLAHTPQELETLLRPLAAAGVVFHPSTRRHSEPAFPELKGTDAERSLVGWTKKITKHPTRLDPSASPKLLKAKVTHPTDAEIASLPTSSTNMNAANSTSPQSAAPRWPTLTSSTNSAPHATTS
ncbi:MAG TPA: hypothetical protein VE908_15745, partial [Mycobacterium sp.]|nr:hypothetical protein [Mycobacterium sp.]